MLFELESWFEYFNNIFSSYLIIIDKYPPLLGSKFVLIAT